MPGPDQLHFTDDDEANALIATDPMALLVGFALDQQVTVQKAFTGALAIKQRLGTLDAAKLAEADLEATFREKPVVHRYPAAMAKKVQELAVHVRDRYDGHAAAVWERAKDADELKENLYALPGFGDMKIKSLGAVLAKRYGVDTAKPLVPSHLTLGDVESAEGLREYQAQKKIHKKDWAKVPPGG